MRSRERKTGTPKWRLTFRPRLSCALALLMLASCRSTRSNSALVEAELRTREREVRALRTELDRAVIFNSALQSELLNRQPEFYTTPGAVIDSPQMMMGSLVRRIELGRGTGGIDQDGHPGDEALQVVIVPQDSDGSALKVPGTATVTAYEVTSEGIKVPLSRWDIPALQLQKSWRSGLFSSGYSLKLPWQKWPSSEKLRLVVQFQTLPNNRPFEVDKDITVKLTALGPGLAPTPPTVPALPKPVLPDGPVLPAVPGAPGTGEQLPPPIEGPILTPGAYLRKHSPDRVEVAKPAPERQPVRLLEPQVPSNERDEP